MARGKRYQAEQGVNLLRQIQGTLDPLISSISSAVSDIAIKTRLP